MRGAKYQLCQEFFFEATKVNNLWKIICEILTSNTYNKLTVFTPLPCSYIADQVLSAIIIPQLESKQHLAVERQSNCQPLGAEEEEEVDGGASDGDTAAAPLQVQFPTTTSANPQKSLILPLFLWKNGKLQKGKPCQQDSQGNCALE